LTRLKLSELIQQEGYWVVAVSDAQQGLAAYEHLCPDLILVDALLPVMDGFTFCQQLQGLSRGDSTPVLMVLGLEDEVLLDQVFEIGAADFVTQPIHWPVPEHRPVDAAGGSALPGVRAVESGLRTS